MTTEMSEIRMDAYYYGFKKTSSRAVDVILSAVACAGKAYHHTESWCDDTAPYEHCHSGNTPKEWIQNAANEAAAKLAAADKMAGALERCRQYQIADELDRIIDPVLAEWQKVNQK